MRTPYWFLIAPLLVVACTAPPTDTGEVGKDSNAASLQPTHQALFATFFPVENDPSFPLAIRQAATAVRDGEWAAFSQSATAMQLIGLLADIKNLIGAAATDFPNGIPAGAQLTAFIVCTGGKTAFVDLSPDKRDQLIDILLRSPSNTIRRIGMSTRLLYMTSTWGSPLGLQLADTTPPLVVNPDIDAYLKDHTPTIPPTRLAYDAAAHTLQDRTGAIDVLVIGSGPSGSVVAHELAAAGRSVVVLEHGAFVVPGALDTRELPWQRESNDQRSSDDGSIFLHNGYAVGGGTAVNIDLAFDPMLPFISARRALWRSTGSLSPDVTESRVAAAYQWVKAQVGTRTPSMAEVNANNQVLWTGSLNHGLSPALYDLNEDLPGQWSSPVSNKRSAVTSLLLPAITNSKNPVALIPEVEVERVVFDANHAVTGVEIQALPPRTDKGVLHDPNGLNLPVGTTIFVPARKIVLSSGSMGSAALLLRSGVSNPNIGSAPVLHAGIPVIGEFDQIIDANQGTLSTVYTYRATENFALESMSAGPGFVAAMIPGTGKDVLAVASAYRHLAGFGVMLVDDPDPNNRVYLDKNNQPVVHYGFNDTNRQRFRRAVAEAVRVIFSAGARRVFIPTNEDVLAGGRFLTNISQANEIESNLAFIANSTLLTSAHFQATNKMGNSAASSVVDLDQRVWGTSGLYVVDSSVFPTSVGANPMQSLYTLAKLFVDRTMAKGAL